MRTVGGSSQSQEASSMLRTNCALLLRSGSFTLFWDISFSSKELNMREVDFSVPEVSRQEKIRQYNQKYREEHSRIIACGCGGKFKEISKYTHYKTRRHYDFLVKKTNGGQHTACQLESQT